MSAAATVLPFRPNAATLKERAAQARDRETASRRAIDRTASILDKLEARAAAFDIEIRALQARKALTCQKAQAIEEEVLASMRRDELDKLQGLTRTLIARPAQPSLDVFNASLIPAEYLRIKTEPMKVEIKTAIARGEEIGGVRLVQNVTLLRR